MGLGKWWLKHGPGSPGAISKAICNEYLILNSNTTLTNNKIIELILANRINKESQFEIYPLRKNEQEIVVEKMNGNIKKLITFFVHRENPEADYSAVNHPDIYQNMPSVISDIVDDKIGKLSNDNPSHIVNFAKTSSYDSSFSEELAENKIDINKKNITILLSHRLDENFSSIFEKMGYHILWSSEFDKLKSKIINEDFDLAIEWDYRDDLIKNCLRELNIQKPVLLCLNWNNKIPEDLQERGYVDYLIVPFRLDDINYKVKKYCKK